MKRAANWNARKRNWLTPRNHNHLRLTRILTCLNLLGLPEHAKALCAFLDELASGEGSGAITETTASYWRGAAAAAGAPGV